MKMIGYIGMLVPLLAIGYMSASAQAQRFAPGYCPTVAAHENFDKTKVIRSMQLHYYITNN